MTEKPLSQKIRYEKRLYPLTSTQKRAKLDQWANEAEVLEAERDKLKDELSNVRREALFAINKAQTERSQQICDEAELSGYSRGVADTEENLKVAESALREAQKLIPMWRAKWQIGIQIFTPSKEVQKCADELEKALGSESLCKLYGTDECSGVNCYAKPDSRCKSLRKHSSESTQNLDRVKE